MTLQINNLYDVYTALKDDLITASTAITVVCKALVMVDMRIAGEPIEKEDVLRQIHYLNEIVEQGGETPIFFGQRGDFAINKIFKPY
jgi:hypothetical protein